MTKYKSKRAGAEPSGSAELDGLFSRLGKVLNAAADLVHKSDGGEFSRVGSIGNSSGMRGMYGLSVRVAPARRPAFRKPAKVREQPAAWFEDDPRDPAVDFYDEGDHYVVVAQFLGAEGSSVQWHVNGRLLRIEAVADDRHYCKELELPSLVDQQTGTATCTNGILELQLWKQ